VTVQGKTALVAGGAKGLGRQIALGLAEAGFRIAVSYRTSGEEASRLVRELESRGVEAMAVQADVADPASLSGLVAQVEREMGGIDALVCSAGPFIRERRRFADYAPEEIRYLMETNLLYAMELTRLVLPGMRRRKWGRILHFGFAHAAEARAWPHRAVYAAAKVGLVSFTRTLAVEEAEHGITVNMICPGDIRGGNKERTIGEVRGLRDPESPRGRPGSGEDIARVAVFLCSPQSDFITGAVIDVSGGADPIRVWPLKDAPDGP